LKKNQFVETIGLCERPDIPNKKEGSSWP